MINLEDVLEPDDEMDCELCEYYNHEEGICLAFICYPFDCGGLPCEENKND